MLALDSVEQVVQDDGDFFLNHFLDRLLSSCSSLTIMISSCDWIDFNADFLPINCNILELEPLQAVNLFIDSIGFREVSGDEVYELTQAHPKLDFTPVLPELTEERREIILTLDSLKRNPETRK